jgi:hypothetical protein
VVPPPPPDAIAERLAPEPPEEQEQEPPLALAVEVAQVALALGVAPVPFAPVPLASLALEVEIARQQVAPLAFAQIEVAPLALACQPLQVQVAPLALAQIQVALAFPSIPFAHPPLAFAHPPLAIAVKEPLPRIQIKTQDHPALPHPQLLFEIQIAPFAQRECIPQIADAPLALGIKVARLSLTQSVADRWHTEWQQVPPLAVRVETVALEIGVASFALALLLAPQRVTLKISQVALAF